MVGWTLVLGGDPWFCLWLYGGRRGCLGTLLGEASRGWDWSARVRSLIRKAVESVSVWEVSCCWCLGKEAGREGGWFVEVLYPRRNRRVAMLDRDIPVGLSRDNEGRLQ